MPHRTLPSAAFAVNRPATNGPVVVSIPHAGRLYPPEILAAARVSRAQLERLEDSWCDAIAARAAEAGATVVQALWARAVADCNSGEGQIAPGVVAVALRTQSTAPGRKELAGPGRRASRTACAGAPWERPPEQDDPPSPAKGTGASLGSTIRSD